MSRKSQLKQLKQYLEQNIKERTTPGPTIADQPQNTATGTRAREGPQPRTAGDATTTIDTTTTPEEDQPEPAPDPNPEEEQQPEPTPEEEDWPDNTTNRDDIINAQGKDYSEWIEDINDLEINSPDIPTINFNDQNQIYSYIPVAIDATKYIYNTKNYRLQALATSSKEIYDEYKTTYESIQQKYDNLKETITNDTTLTEEERTQQLADNETARRAEIEPLNTGYLNASYEIATQITNYKNQKTTETGFIGDVYIQGKLNNVDIDDYAVKNDLETKADKEHTHTMADITDLEITPTEHTHEISDITNLQPIQV